MRLLSFIVAAIMATSAVTAVAVPKKNFGYTSKDVQAADIVDGIQTLERRTFANLARRQIDEEEVVSSEIEEEEAVAEEAVAEEAVAAEELVEEPAAVVEEVEAEPFRDPALFGNGDPADE
ncbi:hypothetical protein HDU67_009619 [Dinochytrium kinnereticum]|nr:hypothetical protein HDU67_009619 [Dinochytrium kinnereticum]